MRVLFLVVLFLSFSVAHACGKVSSSSEERSFFRESVESQNWLFHKCIQFPHKGDKAIGWDNPVLEDGTIVSVSKETKLTLRMAGFYLTRDGKLEIYPPLSFRLEGEYFLYLTDHDDPNLEVIIDFEFDDQDFLIIKFLFLERDGDFDRVKVRVDSINSNIVK